MVTGSIDTGRVKEHRKLRFASIDEALAEVDRIVAADAAGRLHRFGNWTPGQTFGHIASWINYSYDGYPLPPPPWLIRLVLRQLVKRYLRNGMPRGIKIPRVENGTMGIEPMSTSEGANRLRQAFQRLQSDEPAKYDSPAFGPLSTSDRILLNLRHAELHLGFLSY